jgi:hypothetical protein
MQRLMVLLGASALLLLTAPSALAQATVSRFEFVNTVVDTGPLPECLPADLVGTTIGTETTTGQAVETATAVHLRGTNTFDYRTDFTDGRYVIGNAVEHFSYTGNLRELNSFTQVIQEPRTIYSSDGEPIGTVMIHFIAHTTYNAGTGEIFSSVERFFFTCG